MGLGKEKVGAQPDPIGGLLQTLEGRAQAGRGPLEVGSTPSLVPVLLGHPWRRLTQSGGRRALAGGRNALKSVRSR